MSYFIDLTGKLRLTISQAEAVLKALDAISELGSYEQKEFFGTRHGGPCAMIAHDKIRAALIYAEKKPG